MPSKVKVQVCGHCGRGRKGHAMPFGAKRCKLQPLEPSERAIELKRLTDEVTDNGDIAEIVEDTGDDKDRETEITETESIAEKKKKLLEQKALLEKQKKDSEEVIRKQREQLKERQELEELEAMIHQLSNIVEGNQATIINLQTELDNPIAPKAVPGPVSNNQPQPQSQSLNVPAAVVPGVQPVTVPGVQPYVPGVQPVVPGASSSIQPVVPGLCPGVSDAQLMPPPAPRAAASGQASLLDPAMQVYAQAAAADLNHGVARPKAPGHTAEFLLRENPHLAAACGIKRHDQPAKRYTDGKSTAEQFTFKQQLKNNERDRPTYYDFVQGAFKMLYLRLTKDHLPVDQHLKYYETIAGFACQYKWWAVFNLHCQLVYEITELGTRQWGDYIDYTEAMRYLNQEAHIPEKQNFDGKRKPFRDRFGSMRDLRNGNEYANDSQNVRGLERSRSESSLNVKSGKLCYQFNNEVHGCSFGGACSYRHDCTYCDRMGVTGAAVKHPAMYCSAQGQRSSQAGASAAGGGGGR